MTLAGIAYTLIGIEEALIFVRVLISWFPGIDPWSPWVRALRAVVDPVLDPFRRFLPALGGIDISPLLAIIVLDQVRNVLDYPRSGVHIGLVLALALIARSLIVDLIILAIIIVALRLLLSFFHTDPWSPMVRMVREWSQPLVRPFATVLPRSRSLDIPALVATVALIVVLVIARALLDTVVNNVA